MKGREILGAGLVYAGLVAWQLYPAWWEPAHGFVGDHRHPDTISNLWLYRWVAERLSRGESILHNPDYYLPIGDAPWLAGNGSDAVPYSLVAGLGWPASLLLWVAATLLVNGLGGLALARRLGASAAASTLAGAALVLFPYVDVELGGARYAQAPIGQIALFLLAWHDLLDRERPGPLRAAATGVLYGLVSFTYWYHGVWAAILGLCWFVFRPRPRVLPAFLIGAAAVVAWPLSLFLGGWAEIPGTTEESFPHELATQSSLPPWFWLWGRPGFWGRIILPALLWAPLLALLLPGRPRLAWGHKAALLAAVACWSLCLGPYPSWLGGADSGLPGPFWLYDLARPLRRFWWPYRHVAPMGIALVPLAALALDRVIDAVRAFADEQVRPWVPVAIVLVGVLSLPGELRARGGIAAAPISRWDPPEAWSAVAALPGEALLQLPITPQRVRGQASLSYQWLHGKRLLNGHAMWVDRVRPPAWDAWVAQTPFLVALGAMERGEATTLPGEVGRLTEVGVRWILLDEAGFSGTLSPMIARYREAFGTLFGAPVLDQDGVAAWDLARVERPAVEVPAAELPGLSAGREGEVPDYGEVQPLGWKAWERSFPPTAR